MSTGNPYDPNNPYSSPMSGGGPSGGDYGAVRRKVLPPAIALIVVGVLGLLASLFNIFTALASGPVQVDPNAPEFVRQMQQGSTGPMAAVIQGAFVLLNCAIIGGGVQMSRMQMRTYGIAASVMAIVNLGTCCCILGIPVGIWSLVVLMNQEVADAFRAQSY